ncbi:hypothetical protein LIPSTDRAFT_69351 [Lipomyces starkeyi NRRL Y-11557]|uniref:Uncharacterized protein n=1 Tax=Lipomyces starkeyi NRRL Y-11557 TaxID=675824 RepID=A0A1E3QBT0_LIPST|nr:hypothetical protein LIPSTDRAFT_69351 [Lipomyces starkeyi NRRL Y-11557]
MTEFGRITDKNISKIWVVYHLCTSMFSSRHAVYECITNACYSKITFTVCFGQTHVRRIRQPTQSDGHYPTDSLHSTTSSHCDPSNATRQELEK